MPAWIVSFFIRLRKKYISPSCHGERSPNDPELAKRRAGESNHPENVFFTMPRQGILPRHRPLLPAFTASPAKLLFPCPVRYLQDLCVHSQICYLVTLRF